MCYLKFAIIVQTLKVNSLESYSEGPYEYKWIRLQALCFFVDSLVLGYQLGINLKCWKTRDHFCFGLFPTLSGCCVFAWFINVFVYENCLNV